MTTYDNVVDLLDVQQDKGDRVLALCPAHDDERASLSVAEAENGQVLMYCFAGCKTADVVSALGLKMADLFPSESKLGVPVDVYTYTNELGKPLYRKIRFEKDAGKTFVIERYEDGTWQSGIGDTKRTIYRLPEVLAAEDYVFYVEGEKDVETLRQLGYVATTAGGRNDWQDEYARFFQGVHVRIIADNDRVGIAAAEEVRTGLADTAASVELFIPPGVKDVTDHVNRGGSLEDLVPLRDDSLFGPLDRLSYELPPEEWLWTPWVPAGPARVLVHGPAGALKSLWAMWLSQKLADRGDRVAYFSTEMTKAQTVRRANRLDAAFDLYTMFTMGENLEELIRLFKGYSLLVVDSWSSTSGGYSSNDNDAISQLDVDFFQPLIEGTGACLMILDNTGKDTLTDKGDKVKQTMARGASRKRDVVEQELHFRRPMADNNFRVTISCEKTRSERAKPLPITVETTEGDIEFYYVEGGKLSSKKLWNEGC